MSEIHAYILGDGEFVSAGDLERFAKQGAKNLKTDPFKYRADEVIAPPYDLSKLVKFLETNTEHYRCCVMKAHDVCGAYQLQPREGVKNPNQNQRAQLETWLTTCHGEFTFVEVLQRVWLDRESTGTGYLEVIRDVSGKMITGVDHVAATTVRVRKDGSGYLQRRGTSKVYFKKFGDERSMYYASGEIADGKLSEDERANELMAFPIHHPMSDFYGMPDILPALGAIVGNLSVRDYNLQFFENNAVPQYAVIVRGGSLDDSTKRVISDYFKEHIKGQAHKTLVIPVPNKETEVKLLPLAVQLKDGSFTVYRKDNRDEIIRAHGVPPARIGIIESGNLGGGTGESQTHTYKDAIVEPRQTALEYRINDKLIRDGLGITDWVIKFEDLDLEDDKGNSDVARENVKAGIWTLGQAFRYIGRFTDEAFEGEDVPPFIMTATEPILLRDLVTIAETKRDRTLNPPTPPAFNPIVNPDPAPADDDVEVAKRLRIRKAQRDTAVDAFKGDLVELLSQFFNGQANDVAADVVAKLEAGEAPESIIKDLDLTLWEEQLSGPLETAYAELYVAGANEGMSSVGVTGSFDLENPQAVAFAEQRAAELLKIGPDGEQSITESTRNMLREVVAKAVETGASPSELAKILEDAFLFSPQRAENIAIYELGNAYVQGNIAGWEASGVVAGYEWSTMGDDRVRPEHLDNEAAGVVKFGEAFPSGDFAPPTDPNCRCDLLPVLKG